MDTRRIGTLQVSIAGLGCNNFGRIVGEAETARIVSAAIDAGVTFFDTADLYSEGLSEEYLGRALQGRRERIVLGTKFGMMAPPKGVAPASAEWTTRSCENSLKRLRTDRIDLFMLHQPDPATPIAETLGALGALVRAGKVIEIGCSNFTIDQLAESEAAAQTLGTPRFASVQNECSLLRQEDVDTVVPECAARRVAYLPYFPLASGILTGKYRRDVEPPEGTRLARATPERRSKFFNDANFAIADRLGRFAADRGHTLHELALSWLASLPAVASVIPGATTVAQARANAKATVAWTLTSEELAEVRRLSHVQDPTDQDR